MIAGVLRPHPGFAKAAVIDSVNLKSNPAGAIPGETDDFTVVLCNRCRLLLKLRELLAGHSVEGGVGAEPEHPVLRFTRIVGCCHRAHAEAAGRKKLGKERPGASVVVEIVVCVLELIERHMSLRARTFPVSSPKDLLQWVG